MRQTAVGKYSRCGAGRCCTPVKKRRLNKLKLKPSKSKCTKGYKVHLDAVRNYLERQDPESLIPFHDLVTTLNINAGYAMTCLKTLKTQGVKIHISKKGMPHDSYREDWNWRSHWRYRYAQETHGYFSGWRGVYITKY